MPLDKNPAVEMVKNVISTIALIFSIAIVMGLIFTEQTCLAQDVHPCLAVVFCGLLSSGCPWLREAKPLWAALRP